MAGNFGVGLGSFLSGVTQGAQAYSGIQTAKARQKAADLQLKRLERDQASEDRALEISAQGMDEAQAGSDGKIENVMNNYLQNTAPKLQQYWLSQGEVDKANAFGKWINDSNVQQGMKYSAAMIRDAQTGNADGVMNNMVKLYNQPGYFEDGMSAVSANLRRDKDGNAAGMDIVLRDNATGKERTHTFNNMNDVYNTALQFGAPEKVFDWGMQQLKAGQDAAVAAAKEGRDWNRELTGKQIDQGYRLEDQANASNLRMAEERAKQRDGTASPKVRDAKATISFLKSYGADDSYIKANLPSILGLENRSRPMASRIDNYIKMRTETDRKFGKMALPDQINEARNYISEVDTNTGEDSGMGLGLTSGGSGSISSSPDAADGVLYLDTKTGRVISR